MKYPNNDRLSHKATILLWCLLLCASGLGIWMLTWINAIDYQLAQVRGDGIVNLELAWRSDDARRIIAAWGDPLVSRAKLAIRLDFVLILGYVVALTTAFWLAWKPLTRSKRHPLWLLWLTLALPLLAGAFDVAENTFMFLALSGRTGGYQIWPLLTTIAAAAKFTLLGVFLILAAYFARPAFATMARVRFSLLMLAIGVAVLFVPQWQEMLRATTETGPDGTLTTQQIVRALCLAIASLLAAFSSWYAARVMYMFRFDGYHGDRDDPMFPLKNWLPRVLGAAIPLLIALGYLVSAPTDQQDDLKLPLLLQLIALALFLIVVVTRRRIFPALRDSQVINTADKASELHTATLRPLAGLAIANLAFFLLFLFLPELGTLVGAAAAVVFAVALLIPVGSMFVYGSIRLQFPLLLVLLGLAVVFSLVNDNHSVRLCGNMKSTQRECRDANDKPLRVERAGPLSSGTDIEQFLKQWVAARRPDSKGKLPVFIVSAEGGGIRAAYWTAHVLATLQDQAREQGLDFANHLLAISGVSGGSLGGAVFAASSKRLASAPGDACTEQSTCFREVAHKMLGEDFLSPTVATLLFPDLLQRFLPTPVFDDRAVTLETAWETAWQDATGSQTFAEPFDALWQTGGQAAAQPPLLLLNSTVVETGQRLILSPLELPVTGLGFDQLFRNAIDGRSLVGNQIPLSTAVHLSARFTYVSPAGKVFVPASKEAAARWYRLVDGGYFENSGTVTALELLDAVLAFRDTHPEVARLEPFIIHISNEPIAATEAGASGGRPSFQPVMGEVLSPLRALLNVRPARGFQAREYLQRHMSDNWKGQARHVHFLLCRRQLDLPLGWMLSKAVRTELESQLSPEQAIDAGAPAYNAESLKYVLAHLSGEGPLANASEKREANVVKECSQQRDSVRATGLSSELSDTFREAGRLFDATRDTR